MKVAPVGNPAHRKRTYVKNRRATVKDELEVVHGDEETKQAVEDWHYWVEVGYEF
jgi:hypothetical protein